MKAQFKIEHLFFILLILCAACQKDKITIAPENSNDNNVVNTATLIVNEDCISINTYQNQLQFNAESNLLITEIEYTAENYVVHYATGESLPICKDSLFCWQFLPDWSVDFVFTDSTNASAIFWADSFKVEIQSELNPSGYAPLNAQIEVSSKLNCTIDIKVIGQDGDITDVNKSFTETDTLHSLPILGLYSNYLNKVLVTSKSNNFIIDTTTIFIQTTSLELQLPEIIIDVNQVQQMQQGFQLINIVKFLPNIPFMIDAFGKVRWYLDYRYHPELFNLVFDLGLLRMNNGNFLIANRFSSIIYEIDMFGIVLNCWPISPYGFHHSVTEKPNGNLLMTAQLPANDHLLGGISAEDQIIEIDRSTGAILKAWDLRYLLDETRLVHYDFNFGGIKDWAHLNEVIYDESDNTIIFSAKHQSTVCKVDYNDNVKWILGADTAWGVSRLGTSIDQFSLTAVNQNNQSFSNGIQSGIENIEEFEWNWFQHAIKKIGPNRYLMFDNGNNRNFGNTENYSRAVIYQIDEANMTVKQEWTYGRERGEETYSPCCSDVVFYEESNHIIWSPGYIVDYEGTFTAKAIEVDYNTKDVLFEATFNSEGNAQGHRSKRINIYPN